MTWNKKTQSETKPRSEMKKNEPDEPEEKDAEEKDAEEKDEPEATDSWALGRATPGEPDEPEQEQEKPIEPKIVIDPPAGEADVQRLDPTSIYALALTVGSVYKPPSLVTNLGIVRQYATIEDFRPDAAEFLQKNTAEDVTRLVNVTPNAIFFV
jgi:hypothetical protein